LIEAGLHEAVCYSIVDIGTVHSDLYSTDQRKIVLIWEIPDSRIDIKDKGNLPRAISKKYTMSLGTKANLRKDLVSWRTRDFTPEEEASFELQKLLGASCILNIVHNRKQDGTPYAMVGAVLPLKGKKLVPENPFSIYGIEENGLDIPNTLPPWLVEEIKKSPEYQKVLHPDDGPQADQQDDTDPGTEDDTEIPF
jgi:hypothetical protein